MGELHLEILRDRMFREFNVEANVGKPQVSYKETITVPAKIETKYVKQSGGRGNYGHVRIKIKPMDLTVDAEDLPKNTKRANGFEFIFFNIVKKGKRGICFFIAIQQNGVQRKLHIVVA